MNDKILYKIEMELPLEWIEGVSNRIMELGIAGVEIDDATLPAMVSTYIEGRNRLDKTLVSISEYLDSLAEIFGEPAPPIKTIEIHSEDWAHAWKRYFKPLEIGNRFTIKPTWTDLKEPGDRLVLEIDPEMAFGTGNHETTRMCLETLENVIDNQKIARLLDVGTGTGLLAIAAAKLGVQTVVGTDIDPIAVETAERNAILNKVGESCAFNALPLEEQQGTFDLVVANITSDTLIMLAKSVATLQKPGDILILTGIVSERADEVQKHYESMGYGYFDFRVLNEWTLLQAYKR